MDISYEEAILDEIEGTLAALSEDVDVMILDKIPDHITDIMNRVTKLGICKADGEELVKLGAIRSDLINHLGQYRTTAGLNTVANEVDKSGLVGKAITAGIVALVTLLGYILYKLFKFILNLGGGTSSGGGGGSIASVVDKDKVFDGVPKGEKSNIEDLLSVAIEEIVRLPIGELMGKDVVKKFVSLGYPKKYSDPFWIREGKYLTFMAKIMEGGGTVYENNRDKFIAYANEAKLNPRDGIKELAETANMVLVDIYGDRPLDPRFKDWHMANQLIKKWLNNSNWERKFSHEQLTIPAAEFITSHESAKWKEMEKEFKELLKEAEDNKELVQAKIKEHQGDSEYTTALRVVGGDSVKLMALFISKAIIPYLTSAVKIELKLKRVQMGTTVRFARILEYVAGKLKREPDSDMVKNLSSEFIRLLNDSDLPSKLATLREPVLKRKPKSLGELLTTVVIVDFKD